MLAVDRARGVDGLHPVNLGRLVQGADAPRPCTPLGIQRLLVATRCPSPAATW